MRQILYSLFLLLAFTQMGFSQPKRTEVFDLLEQLNKTNTDTTKVQILNNLADMYASSDMDKTIEYTDQAISISKKIKYYNGLSSSYYILAKGLYYQYLLDSIKYYYDLHKKINSQVTDWEIDSRFENIMGMVNHIQGNYPKAILYYQKSLNTRIIYNDKKGAASGYNNIGGIYFDQGDYKKALDNYFKSLTFSEEMKDTALMVTTQLNIGNVYNDQGKNRNALKSYLKTIAMAKDINQTNVIADGYRNIGTLYNEFKKPDSALFYFKKSLKTYQTIKDTRGEMVLYNLYGLTQLKLIAKDTIHGYTYNANKALEYFDKSLNLNNSGIEDIEEKIISYQGIGRALTVKKQYTNALKYLNNAKKLCKDIKSIANLKEVYQDLSKTYAQTGNFKKAYESHVLYKNLDDTLKNDANVELLTQMSMQHEFDKQQKEQEFQQAQRELEYQQKQKRDRLIRMFIIIVLMIVSGFSIQVLRSYQRKKKDNVMLAKQKEEIEKQKEEITDSIKYAKRIQTAILPSKEFANKILPEHFILFRPRDIVSGDYYWMNKIDNKVIIAAADCTGHGVPGAFMSMLGVSFLNEIVNQNNQCEPHLILNQLRAQVKQTLGQTGKEGEAKDGMDIALCVIDFDAMKLWYAGAYNPLYLYRNGELLETKADKMPIGIYIREKESFTCNEVDLQKGDTFYIFSDGYADQFGGLNGNKYKSKPFKTFLANIQPMSMAQQREALDKNIDEWRGDIEQIDDIIVLGVRI